MNYVYLLQSLSHPEQRHVGMTADIDRRLTAHHAGQSTRTANFRPWTMVSYRAFTDEAKAITFE